MEVPNSGASNEILLHALHPKNQHDIVAVISSDGVQRPEESTDIFPLLLTGQEWAVLRPKPVRLFSE